MLIRFNALFQKYREVIVYVILGGLTTAVNFLVYWPCVHWLQMSATVSNVVAWGISVLFAFLTNKPLAFQSHDWAPKVVISELFKFVSCRLASGVIETVFIGITVDLLHYHELIMKLIVSVIVIVLNYIGSKLLVFRK